MTLRVLKKLPAKLDHLIAVNEFRIHLALACRASTTYALVRFETDVDLAAERHAALLDLIPDAKVALRSTTTGEGHHFLVEVDLGTEAVTWLVRHKLTAYDTHAALGHALYGLRDPLVVLVVPGLRRARNIARTMDAMCVRARVVLAVASMLSEGNVLAAAYATPGDLVAAPPDADGPVIFTRRLLPP